MPLTYHPCPDNAGRQVVIQNPHLPSPAATWTRAHAKALCVPGSAVGVEVNGLLLTPWLRQPIDDAGRESLAAQSPISEPAFHCPAGLKAAAGAIVVEPDGRIWCVAPTNRFGGHEFTFPKGRADGRSLAASALTEVFEETGLQVRLLAFVCDVRRTQTYTRFYLAERVGGCPSSAGWETQGVALVPPAELLNLLTHPGDKFALESFEAMHR